MTPDHDLTPEQGEEADRLMNDLVADLRRVGGLVRDLGGGREMHLVRQVYNVRLSVGPRGGEEWDNEWCYDLEHAGAAVAAFNDWDGVGDAPGPWIRSTYGASGGFRRRGR